MFRLLVVCVTVCVAAVAGVEDDSADGYRCGYYMADSKVPGFGRGVFAGQALSEGVTMFDSSTVLVTNAVAMETMLAYYVFTDENDNYEITMFGPMLMLNHANNESVDYIFTEKPVAPPHQVLHSPFSTHTEFQVHSLYNATVGSELFTYYGTRWFRDRGIKSNKVTVNTTVSYTEEELVREGKCLTDIFVTETDLPFAGKGVFASRSFKKGEPVSISPVLVLPRHVFEGDESKHSVLLNYLITSDDVYDSDNDSYVNTSDVALLPLTQAGMMNHGAVDVANINIEWFQWPTDTENRLEKWSAAKLEEAQFAPLDLQYVATRDIFEGEELLLDYGPEWEHAWSTYLDKMLEWHEVLNLIEARGIDLDSYGMAPPQFRAPISAPPGLFPESFFVDTCLGPIPCESTTNVKSIRDLHGAEEIGDVVKAREYAALHYSGWETNHNGMDADVPSMRSSAAMDGDL